MTARERELAEKIMKDPCFDDQEGRQLACHNRFRFKSWRELEGRIENAKEEVDRGSAQLKEEQNNFEDTWNEKLDKRHENFVTLFIKKGAQNKNGDPPQKLSEGGIIAVVI